VRTGEPLPVFIDHSSPPWLTAGGPPPSPPRPLAPQYSNHARNAKNYGETFWVWDWMFGTTSKLHGTAQGSKP
jgi:hypothetical protein